MKIFNTDQKPVLVYQKPACFYSEAHGPTLF